MIENVGRSGTSVNGKVITGSISLKDRDVIRFGTLEFEFRLLAELAVAPNASPPAPTGGASTESFKTKAERRYQDGEKAMAGGNWSEAVEAFKGALVFAPDYRDASQSYPLARIAKRQSSSTTRPNAFALRKILSGPSGSGVCLEAGSSLVDRAGIREVAECGQKYGRAIGELQMGNRDMGAELLRDVITSHPDFEDASQRLENLAGAAMGYWEHPPSLTGRQPRHHRLRIPASKTVCTR